MKCVITNNKKMKDIIRGRIRYFPSGLSGRKVSYPVSSFLYLSYLDLWSDHTDVTKKVGMGK